MHPTKPFASKPNGLSIRSVKPRRKREPRMPKKAPKTKASPATGAGVGIDDFMNGLFRMDGVRDLSKREEEFISTGDFRLDNALGGGIAVGAMTSSQGDRGCGKTLLALQIAKNAIEQNGKAVIYNDAENKISTKALRSMGLLDNDMFRLISTTSLEDTINVVRKLLESGLFGLIVLDSLDALVPDVAIDAEADFNQPGVKAKKMSEQLPILSALAVDNDCAIIFTRQIREKIGGYGNPSTTSGGKALGFFATTELWVRPNKDGDVKEDGMLTYQGMKTTVMKSNAGARPIDPIEMRLYIGDDKAWGVDQSASLVEEALRRGIFYKEKPSSTKIFPSQDLLAEVGCEEEELVFTGKNRLSDALAMSNELQDSVLACIMFQKENDIAPNPFHPRGEYGAPIESGEPLEEVDGEFTDDAGNDFEDLDEQ